MTHSDLAGAKTKLYPCGYTSGPAVGFVREAHSEAKRS